MKKLLLILLLCSFTYKAKFVASGVLSSNLSTLYIAPANAIIEVSYATLSNVSVWIYQNSNVVVNGVSLLGSCSDTVRMQQEITVLQGDTIKGYASLANKVVYRILN